MGTPGWTFVVAVGEERPEGSGGDHAVTLGLACSATPPGLQPNARRVKVAERRGWPTRESDAQACALAYLGYTHCIPLFRDAGVTTYRVYANAGPRLVDVEVVSSSFGPVRDVAASTPTPTAAPTAFGPFRPYHFP